MIPKKGGDRVKRYKLIGVVFILVVLLFLAGCGTVPSVGSGVSINVRVLNKTFYTATIELTIANYSNFTFYVTEIGVWTQGCIVGSEICQTSDSSISLGGSLVLPLYPGEVSSDIQTLPISDGYSRIRWIEYELKGRLGGSYITVTSNRVYF